MGKKKRDRRNRRNRQRKELHKGTGARESAPIWPFDEEFSMGTGPLWLEDDGCHAILPGSPPSPEQLERASKIYQEKIRNSPLWDQMVAQFGPAKAEELLKQFRVEIRP